MTAQSVRRESKTKQSCSPIGQPLDGQTDNGMSIRIRNVVLTSDIYTYIHTYILLPASIHLSFIVDGRTQRPRSSAFIRCCGLIHTYNNIRSTVRSFVHVCMYDLSAQQLWTCRTVDKFKFRGSYPASCISPLHSGELYTHTHMHKVKRAKWVVFPPPVFALF